MNTSVRKVIITTVVTLACFL